MTTGELLTGNGVAWLERRCSGVCEVVLVERVGGDEHVLPESFAAEDSRYLISPDGVYVLRVTTEGSGELYLPESGAVWWVNGSGIGQAAWAPDSTFVAWIDDSGDPLLKLMLPQRHDWIVVDLGLLGAAPPVDGELHVVLSE